MHFVTLFNKTDPVSTITKPDPAEILKDNLEHSIFSWSKQSGLNPMSIERAKGSQVLQARADR